MIDASGLRLAYRGIVVLDGVSLQLRNGELLAIIGPNGAGKSTLLRALAGLHVPAQGTVSVDGHPVGGMNSQTRARHIALIEVDNTPVPNVTVREAVAQGRLPHRPWWRWSAIAEDDAVVDAALERAQLSDRPNRALETLSSGEQQRAWLALALAQQAPNLLLDEPTSHLDLRHAMRILALLRQLAEDGAAVAVVFHDLNLAAAYADRIALVGQGRLLACDAVENVFLEPLLSAAYEAPITVRYEDGMLFAFAIPPTKLRSRTW
ncbi:MAG: ABC transporter ATP-binding protein [Vulcanimicrobiaceae bacterium]